MSHLDMPGDTMDFGALAARLAVNTDDVRACLLMSGDGLTLGVYPTDQEAAAREVWDRLLSIGRPDRGFLVVGDELWIVARRGSHVGIVVASVTATPGLLLDRLEFTLRSAEEAKMHEEAAPAGPRSEGARRPRTPLHPEPPEPAPELERDPDPEPEPRSEDRPAWLPAGETLESARAEVPLPPMLDLSSGDGPTEAQASPANEPAPTAEAKAPDGEEPFDPVRAAMEFASMTGAVGTIPTMPRPAPPPLPPAKEEPITPAPQEADVPGDAAEALADPLEDVLVDPIDQALADPIDEALVGPLEEQLEPPLAPPLDLPLDLPLDDMPALPGHEDAEETPEPVAITDPEPDAVLESLAREADDEAEVDPVALAREFAQLFDDDDEEGL